MANIYVKSGGGSIGSGSYRGIWAASQTYALGDRVCGVTTSDYWIFECTTAGTAGGTEPTWTKTDGVTTTDNTVTWTARIPDTWADATLTLAKAIANDANGDTIYVSNNHSESTAANTTMAPAGTVASPVRIICADDGATPPTSVATTALVALSGNYALAISAGVGTSIGCYVYGVRFATSYPSGSNGASTISIRSQGVFESCAFELYSSLNTAPYIVVGANGNYRSNILFKNCKLRFGHTTGYISFGFGEFEFINCSIASGSSAITKLCALPSIQIISLVKFIDCDFSNAASTLTVVSSDPGECSKVTLINCKLPNSWTGGLITNAISNMKARIAMYNCDSGSTNYRLWIETYAGSIKSETTLVKTGGASDGTTAISWKLTTTANANEYVAPLITDDMAIWIENIGQSNVISVDILHDSTTPLTDAEVWLEIDYLGSSSYPLGTPSSDKRATILTTPTNQNSSAAQWVSSGMANPNKQKLEVTFTPQMKGFVYARVCLAKPSYTIYVDPKPTVI